MLEGKKINELPSISTISDETVVPAVYVNNGSANSEASKVSIDQIKAHINEDNYTKNQVNTLLNTKQDKLTAGNNITIEESDENLVISATAGGGASITPGLPVYTTSTAVNAKESATYNTQYIFDSFTPSASLYPAFYYSRNPGGQSLIINVDGVNYAPQLPNAYEINAMYPLKDSLNAIDPTLVDGTGTIRLFKLVNNNCYALTSNFGGTNSCIVGHTDNYNNWWISYYYVHQAGADTCIYPVFEIPVN